MATAADSRAERVGLDPHTAIGHVSLTVSDLDASRRFYEQVIGLSAAERDDGALALGAAGERPLLVLHGDPAAPGLDRRTTGLYHLAILLPTRRDLAAALVRVAQAQWPLQGASDHLVSEALYLADPDGNGIEIYRDRPQSEWRYDDGVLQMATLPLDLDDVIDALGDDRRVPARVPVGTKIGHVHLQAAELDAVESFYADVIGLDVTVRLYEQALFLSAGGYHHHVGLNTWHSAGGSPPAPGTIGLRHWELVLVDEDQARAILDRARAAGVPIEEGDGRPLLRDPSGNALLLSVG